MRQQQIVGPQLHGNLTTRCSTGTTINLPLYPPPPVSPISQVTWTSQTTSTAPPWPQQQTRKVRTIIWTIVAWYVHVVNVVFTKNRIYSWPGIPASWFSCVFSCFSDSGGETTKGGKDLATRKPTGPFRTTSANDKEKDKSELRLQMNEAHSTDLVFVTFFFTLWTQCTI